MNFTFIMPIVLILALFYGSPLPAADYENHIISTQATNGLTLGVNLYHQKLEMNSTEQPIILLFKAPTNTTSLLFGLKNEYQARFELHDSNNRPIVPTESGEAIGNKFDAVQWDIKNCARQPHSPIIAKDHWSSGEVLPKISELFALKEPGTYRLKVEVQIMVQYLDMTKKQVRQIVRFPPLEIMVTRQDSPTNSK